VAKLSTIGAQPSGLFEHSHKITQRDDFKDVFRFKKLSTPPTTTTELLLKTEKQV
jgi:hypothetical protein